jgi:hypothetical protein
MATLAAPDRSQRWRLAISQHEAIAFGCLAIVLLLQFHLVLTRAINWDEFWFYAQVEQAARGVLAGPLQTIHVRLFAWLTDLPGNGVDHIVAGRTVMFGAELVTLAAVWGIASHFTDRRTGLLCVLAYLGSIYTFQHGFSFRADPLAACLSMAALLVLLKSRFTPAGIAVFSLLLGLAGIVTIKTALMAPAFAGIAWLRLAESDNPRRAFANLALCAIGAGAAFAVLYNLHAQGLGTTGAQNQSTSPGAATVRSAADYVIGIGLPAYPQYILAFMVKSPLQSILVFAAPLAILRSELSRDRKLALGGMLATALAFILYRNTLPYFYAFILPPLIIGASPALRAAAQRYTFPFAAAALTLGAVVLWAKEPPSPIDKQRLIVEAADVIFPDPVAYFDFCAMLGTYHKANPFMTTWGMKAYRDAGVPAMRQTMEREIVPLLLASEQENYPTFRAMLSTAGPSPYFVDEDALALRDNYLPFWGPYWLAGKAVPADGAEHAEEFLVPGPYTVHDAPVRVNDQLYRPGDVVHLPRGVHRLQSEEGIRARLIWGEHLDKPNYSPPALPYWTDF